MDTLDSLEEIRSRALVEIGEASSPEALDEIRVKLVGRKGLLTSILKGIGKLPPEERPFVGKRANEIKKEVLDLIHQRLEAMAKGRVAARIEGLDPTLPGRAWPQGGLHPITQTMEEVCSIFQGMGFRIAQGPDIELDFYNFEALNIPADHPARDMQDTFYIDEGRLLRTHTSPIQIRTMEAMSPPLRIIAPGKVYRCDSDVTHTPMFHQVEGLMVDKEISFSDLKGVLTVFIRQIFGESTGVRFRPSFFPFTEPSAEVDIQCVICGGEGCRVCSQTGWIEVLGAGMVHPEVFRHVGYDPEEISGFAFGLGMERIAMLRFGINDIRLFYDNDIRFLNQFQTV